MSNHASAAESAHQIGAVRHRQHGYSDVQVGEREFDLMRPSRTLFMKLGYAWRL